MCSKKLIIWERKFKKFQLFPCLVLELQLLTFRNSHALHKFLNFHMKNIFKATSLSLHTVVCFLFPTSFQQIFTNMDILGFYSLSLKFHKTNLPSLWLTNWGSKHNCECHRIIKEIKDSLLLTPFRQLPLSEAEKGKKNPPSPQVSTNQPKRLLRDKHQSIKCSCSSYHIIQQWNFSKSKSL